MNNNLIEPSSPKEVRCMKRPPRLCTGGTNTYWKTYLLSLFWEKKQAVKAHDKPGILSATHPLGPPTEGAKPRCVIWLADLPLPPDNEHIPETIVTLNWLTLLVCFDPDVLQAGMSEAQGILSLLDPLHKSPAKGGGGEKSKGIILYYYSR